MACIFFQDESLATPAEEKEKFSGEIPISKLNPDINFFFYVFIWKTFFNVVDKH